MILSADSIVNNQIIITNGKGQKAQVGYDLTLDSASRILSAKADHGHISAIGPTKLPEYSRIVPNSDGVYKFYGGMYSLTFEQGCKLPQGVCCWITHRSSILRCGAFISSGLYDPGFECEQMGAVLIVPADGSLTIERGARVAQFFASTAEDSVLYDGQWQGAKDVK
jgi:deoxycytidine triphosphate deaminase